MTDKLVQDYIRDERARCAALVELLAAEPEFLLYCIKAPIFPSEDLDRHRKRFGEYQDPDDFEDLM